MIKRGLKGLSNIIFVFLLIVLAISFYSWIQIKVLNKPYSSFMGYSIFEVITGSMSGTIEVDDYIIVSSSEEIDLMDVITFRDGNSLVTHRVIEINDNGYVTKGDANNSEDLIVKKEDVIGEVVFVIPKGAIWKKVFTDPTVLILIIITMVIFTVYFSMDDKKKEIDTKIMVEEKKKSSKENQILENTKIENNDILEEFIEEKDEKKVKQEEIKKEEKVKSIEIKKEEKKTNKKNTKKKNNKHYVKYSEKNAMKRKQNENKQN